jgi:hypothetical protein
MAHGVASCDVNESFASGVHIGNRASLLLDPEH